MKQKKAIETAELVIIIIVIVSAIILVPFAANLVKQGKSKIDIDSCRFDVIKASKTAHFIPLENCYTNELGNIELKSKEPEKKKKELSSVIGKELYDCWYQFIQDKESPWKGSFAEYDINCFICSTFITPDIDISASKDLEYWLKTAKLENSNFNYFDLIGEGLGKADGKNLYLYDTIGWDKGTKFFNPFDNAEFYNILYSDKIEKNKQYYILAWTVTQKELRQNLLDSKSPITMLVITDSEDINKLSCDYLHQKIKDEDE